MRGARRWMVLAAWTAFAVHSPLLARQVGGVLRSEDGRPLTSQEIKIVLRGDGIVRSTTAGAGGRFIFPGVNVAGPVFVQAIAPGRTSDRALVFPPDTAVELVVRVLPHSGRPDGAPGIPGGMVVGESAIAMDVIDREPVETLKCRSASCWATLRADVGSVVHWTRIVGGMPGSHVEHVWYWGDREMRRVSLPIGGLDWRTWSQKQIDPGWVGDWRVDVFADDGTLIGASYFRIEARAPRR